MPHPRSCRGAIGGRQTSTELLCLFSEVAEPSRVTSTDELESYEFVAEAIEKQAHLRDTIDARTKIGVVE